MADCFKCGMTGHIARDCTYWQEMALAQGDPRPLWCGECDQRTRHLELPDGNVIRCRCHPESHKLLPQQRRCPRCQALTLQWDTAPCGYHLIAGVPRPYGGPPPVPDAEYARRFAVTEPLPDGFPGGLPDPPEYPAVT